MFTSEDPTQRPADASHMLKMQVRLMTAPVPLGGRISHQLMLMSPAIETTNTVVIVKVFQAERLRSGSNFKTAIRLFNHVGFTGTLLAFIFVEHTVMVRAWSCSSVFKTGKGSSPIMPKRKVPTP